MKNRYLSILIVMILLFAAVFPSFALDKTAETPDMEVTEEIRGGSAEAEPKENAEAKTEEAAEKPVKNSESKTAEMIEEKTGEKTTEDEASGEILKEGGLVFVTDGEGSLTLSKEGAVVCTPDKGYEIVSITADKDAGEIEANRQIPVDSLSELTFEKGTTITAEFSRITEDDVTAKPVSATAIFG